MVEKFRALELSCPTCGAMKTVNIPESLFFSKKFGHIKVQIPQGGVCQEHAFVVFLDIKGRIIGYEAIDLSISSIKEPKEEIVDESKEEMTLINLIKSIGFNCVAGLIHAKLFDYPSYLIINNGAKVDLEKIDKVLDGIIPEMYKNNNNTLKTIEFDDEIYPMPTYFYSLVQNQKENAYLMNPRKQVIHMPWQLELELEKSIIKSALEKEKQNEQFKFLAYYLTKFIEDVEITVSILENLKKISKKELTKQLKEKLITSTITKNRVDEIRDFIERRISTTIAKKIQG